MNGNKHPTFTLAEVDFAKFTKDNQNHLVKGLRRFARRQDCEDAAAEAIAKVAGYHPRFHLEKDPGPLDDQRLFNLVFGQAKFILSHRREAAYYEKFACATLNELEELKKNVEDDPLLSDRTRALLLRAIRYQIESRARPPDDRGGGVHIHKLDRKIVRAELIRIVSEVLKRRGIKDSNITAYLSGYFSGLTTKERAGESGLSESNLAVQKCRYETILKDCKEAFRSSPVLSGYFPFMAA